MNQKTIALLDNFTQQTIEVVTQALADKDKLIKELQHQLYFLERQNNDLDYLLTAGQSELRREARDLKQKLANCTCAEVTHE